jgi:hypothetical protein
VKKPQLEKSIKEQRERAVRMMKTAVAPHMTATLECLKAGAILAARRVGLLVRFFNFLQLFSAIFSCFSYFQQPIGSGLALMKELLWCAKSGGDAQVALLMMAVWSGSRRGW